MWYVLQIETGREEQILSEMKSYGADRFCEEIFLPKRELKKQRAGIWQLEQSILFPGYLFVISEQIEGLYQALKPIPQLTKLLGTGEKWTALTKEDISRLERLTGKNAKRTVEFSKGSIKEGKLIITEGSLKGLEEEIVRIDRHKKRAWIRMKIFNEERLVPVGLEILEKE